MCSGPDLVPRGLRPSRKRRGPNSIGRDRMYVGISYQRLHRTEIVYTREAVAVSALRCGSCENHMSKRHSMRSNADIGMLTMQSETQLWKGLAAPS